MKTTYSIIIESDESHPIDPPIRLRQWLKMGLRAFALKCIDIRETTDNPSEGVERASVAGVTSNDHSGDTSHE